MGFQEGHFQRVGKERMVYMQLDSQEEGLMEPPLMLQRLLKMLRDAGKLKQRNHHKHEKLMRTSIWINLEVN